jgi:Flp pilus assembly protein CpaB
MRKVILIIGAVLGLLVAGGIFLFLQLTRPLVVEIPVAINDIPAGSVLRPNLFRIARFSNVDRDSVSKWVTLSNWSYAEGKTTTSDIRTGFPLAKSQVDPNASPAMEMRLSLALSGTNDYYVVIPVGPDEVGNFLQPGDRVDLVVNIGGSGSQKDLMLPGETPEPEPAMLNPDMTTTLRMTETLLAPISKLVMQNMSVLRIDRAKARTQSSSSSSATSEDSQKAEAAPPPAEPGDIKRIYVKVDRDQLEVLSFVLASGKNTIAVRAANGAEDVLATDGVTWDDFVRWFFAQRGNRADGAQPFNAISPVEPNDMATNK